jgi:hypothetical protein
MWRVIWLLAIVHPAFGSEEDWRLQRFNQRYEDFFARLKREQAFDERREAGAKVAKEQRLEWQNKMLAARNEYIRSRKAPPDMAPAYKQWALDQQRWATEHEIARKRYVEIENQIRDLEKRLKKSLENAEYELDP